MRLCSEPVTVYGKLVSRIAREKHGRQGCDQQSVILNGLGHKQTQIVGTSLYNILFVTMATTLMHSLTTKAVDIVLVFLLLVGSVTGAQIGSQIAVKAKPEILRLILAAIVLLVAFRMFLGLFYQPDEIYTLYPL